MFSLALDLRPGTVAVGRLDFDTTGLLVMTDDGELAFRLMHPRFGVEKRYEVTVETRPTEAGLRRLRAGVELDDGVTAPARVRLMRRPGPGVPTRLEVCIHEGRKRQVRRMFAAIGHPVLHLHRSGFGDLSLTDVQPGRRRHLTTGEVAGLRRSVGLAD